MPVQAAHCKFHFPFNSVIKSKENIIQNSENQVVTCCSLLNCTNTCGKTLRKNYNINFIALQARGSHPEGRRHQALKWPRLLRAAEQAGYGFQRYTFEFVVGFLPCSERFFFRVLRYSPLLKNQYFQIPIRSGTHGHVSTSSYELLSDPWVNKLQNYNYNFTISLFCVLNF